MSLLRCLSRAFLCCSLFLLSNLPALAQTLPTTRTGPATNGGCIADLLIETVVFTPGTVYDNDSDADNDDYDLLINLAANSTFSGSEAYASLQADLWANPSSGTPWSGSVLYLANEVTPNGRTAITHCDAEVWSNCEYTVNANPSYPGGGSATNSATMLGSFYLGVSYLNEGGTFDGLMSATLGDSYITITSLDEYGDYWSLEGTLSQSSSSNPNATPTYLDDTIGQPDEFWLVSQATQVNDVIACTSTVQIDTTLNSAYASNGTEGGAFNAQASISVVSF